MLSASHPQLPATGRTQIDLMRVIAAFAVVWLHVSANVVIYRPSVESMSWWTGNVADALSRWCVPLFVMISSTAVAAGSPCRLRRSIATGHCAYCHPSWPGR